MRLTAFTPPPPTPTTLIFAGGCGPLSMPTRSSVTLSLITSLFAPGIRVYICSVSGAVVPHNKVISVEAAFRLWKRRRVTCRIKNDGGLGLAVAGQPSLLQAAAGEWS